MVKKPEAQKWKDAMLYGSILHHVTACCYVFYNLLRPECAPNAEPFQMFKDPQCLSTVMPSSVY